MNAMRAGRAALALLLVACLAAALAGCARDTSDEQAAQERVRQALVGYNLTYYNIAGQPVTETLTAQDITGIELSYHNGQTAWLAVIRGGLWYIYFDVDGVTLLEVQQRFVT